MESVETIQDIVKNNEKKLKEEIDNKDLDDVLALIEKIEVDKLDKFLEDSKEVLGGLNSYLQKSDIDLLEKEVALLDEYMLNTLELEEQLINKNTNILKNPKVLLATGTIFTSATISTFIVPATIFIGTKIVLGGLGVLSYGSYLYQYYKSKTNK